MTLNERIAKALGWRYEYDDWGDSFCWVNADGVYQCHPTDLPSWSSSLDLIHEAEDALTKQEQYRYTSYLANLILRHCQPFSGHQSLWLIRHATAEQCAEAIATVLERRQNEI